uniref:Uncharacterized protein n=1 Tax=Myoviridae sp. ctCo31 TaxID=2825053 RepID=A0A8S5UMH1_9CAUD|nr:MAG TPA: hypothetical protein [Myoviridae sp. ctCo31]
MRMRKYPNSLHKLHPEQNFSLMIIHLIMF